MEEQKLRSTSCTIVLTSFFHANRSPDVTHQNRWKSTPDQPIQPTSTIPNLTPRDLTPTALIPKSTFSLCLPSTQKAPSNIDSRPIILRRDTLPLASLDVHLVRGTDLESHYDTLGIMGDMCGPDCWEGAGFGVEGECSDVFGVDAGGQGDAGVGVFAVVLCVFDSDFDGGHFGGGG